MQQNPPINRELSINMGKLMVAVAWIDGGLAPQEAESLRAIIAHFPGLQAKDRAEIEVFMDHPPDENERTRLVKVVSQQAKTPEEREMVLRCLRDVVSSDGVLAEEEEQTLHLIENALAKADSGFFQSLGQMLWRRVGREHGNSQQHSTQRPKVEDFLRNKVLYYLQMHGEGQAFLKAHPEPWVRTVCLKVGLFLRVFLAGVTEPDAVRAKTNAQLLSLLRGESLAEAEASLLVECAWLAYKRGLDCFLACCALYEKIEQDERIEFFAALLRAVAPLDALPPARREELLDIAHGLLFDPATIRLAKAMAEASSVPATSASE